MSICKVLVRAGVGSHLSRDHATIRSPAQKRRTIPRNELIFFPEGIACDACSTRGPCPAEIRYSGIPWYCMGYGHRGIPRGGIQRLRDPTGCFVRDLTIVSPICTQVPRARTSTVSSMNRIQKQYTVVHEYSDRLLASPFVLF